MNARQGTDRKVSKRRPIRWYRMKDGHIFGVDFATSHPYVDEGDIPSPVWAWSEEYGDECPAPENIGDYRAWYCNSHALHGRSDPPEHNCNVRFFLPKDEEPDMCPCCRYYYTSGPCGIPKHVLRIVAKDRGEA